MPAISVIIVNWNGAPHVSNCLEHLQRQTFHDFEVLVVDNGSTDGSPELLAERFPEVRLLRQTENLGFAAANNLAAAQAQGEWLVLLNNDAFAQADWLQRLQEAIQEQPDFTGFASCQLQHQAPHLLDGAGDVYHALGLAWRAGFGQPLGPAWEQRREIFAPCAAAAAYRRDAFLSVGGFDESFFCYLEDVDLAFRMQLQGHRFLFVPEAVVHHVGSASTGRTSDFARYHGHRNLVWCFLKNMPGRLFGLYLTGHLLLNAFTLLLFSLRGEGGPIWRAKRDALLGLPRILRERRKIQSARKASSTELAGRMAHGFKSLLLRSKAPAEFKAQDLRWTERSGSFESSGVT